MSQSIWEKEFHIQGKIKAAFESEFDQTRAHDIGFHMTDWLLDVKALIDGYSRIDELTNDQIKEFVLQFLIHVPHHVNAAAKLSGIGKVEDVFEVGIFEDD
jgi:hypothetical protein